MFCEQCKIEIPAAFVKVLASNQCPGCEGEIMSAATKAFLVELKVALAKMSQDPEGLAGWLLSHYELKKIGTGEPTQFHRKPQQLEIKTLVESKEIPMEGLVVSSQKSEVTNKFFKNAEVKNTPDKNAHFKNLVKQIKSGKVEVDPIQPEDFASEEANLDLAEMASALSESSSGVSSSLDPYGSSGGDEEIPSAVLAMANQAQAKQPGGGYNPKDVQALQNILNKNKDARNSILSGGGGKGSFSR